MQVIDFAGNPLPRRIDDDFSRTGGLSSEGQVHVEKGYEAMRVKLVAHFSWLIKSRTVLWLKGTGNVIRRV